jgi:hypothetical protein
MLTLECIDRIRLEIACLILNAVAIVIQTNRKIVKVFVTPVEFRPQNYTTFYHSSLTLC